MKDKRFTKRYNQQEQKDTQELTTDTQIKDGKNQNQANGNKYNEIIKYYFINQVLHNQKTLFINEPKLDNHHQHAHQQQSKYQHRSIKPLLL